MSDKDARGSGAPLLVLDLDGTLVDSVSDLTAAANRMLSARGLPPLDDESVRPMTGDGVAALVRRALASRGVEADAAAIRDFEADYTAHAAERSRLFPGIGALLEEASGAGWRLAVCTNKPEAAARALLSALGIADCMEAIGGGDSFATRKPDPAHLHDTIRAAGARPERAIMVGDHHNDVAAARGAGVPSVFAGWGYGTPAMGEAADAIASQPGNVLALAEALLSRPS